MNCNIVFERSSLSDRLGAQFMAKQYRDCRAIIVYDREKVYFPETQELVEEYRLRNQAKEIRKELKNAKESKQDEEIIEYLSIQLKALTVRLKEFKKNDDELEEKEKKPKRTYILPCTHADCKGTLIDEQRNNHENYVCAICDGITCSKCKMGLQQDTHTCDPDILKTVKMMEKSSKPCPKCNSMIQKISGCNQMFCVVCKCVFDWATLRIEKGFMHNPHYLDWKRQNRDEIVQDIDDLDPNVQCVNLSVEIGLMIEHNINVRVAEKLIPNVVDNLPKDSYNVQIKKDKRLGRYVCNMIRFVINFREYSIPRMESNYDINSNRDLRLKFLTNEMNEEEFKTLIQRRDKKLSSQHEYCQILQTFVDGMNDIVMGYLMLETRSPEQMLKMINSIVAIDLYVNEALKKVSYSYGLKVKTLRRM